MSCPDLKDPRQRTEALHARRARKMARSAHAYVRGSTDKFYEWLGSGAKRILPDGPPVWICGDCHLGNIGPLADADGRIELLVRDFDQTVIGNPAHDLIRLALSLAMAARGSDLSGITTAQMLENMVDAYAGACEDHARSTPEEAHVVQRVLMDAHRRGWKQLARERARGNVTRLPKGRKFIPLRGDERAAIEALAGSADIHRLATRLARREDATQVELLDAAYWVKGCSSLGRARYALLLDVGGLASRDRDFCLLDIKEATRAIAPRAEGAPMPRNNGDRVVAGATAISPALGERMVAASVLGQSVVARELLPEDLKVEVERLTGAEAVKLARALAVVIATAHARQMNLGDRARWHKEMLRSRPRSIEVPSWLWRAVTDLIAIHERAYLEHCRSLLAQVARP